MGPERGARGCPPPRRRGGAAGGLPAWMALVALAAVAQSSPAALRPEQVLVVANRRVPAGMELARYYAGRRGVPEDQLLALRAPEGESCTREAYERRILAPIRERLLAPGGAELRALVLCSGVPLKVAPPQPSAGDRREIESLEAELRELRGAAAEEPDNPGARERVTERLRRLRRSDHAAAVDSELMLARIRAYPLAGWLPNPAFAGVVRPPAGITRWDVLIVARLDGPTPAIARRLVDDAIAAEAAGLRGGAFLDARWPEPPAGQAVEGYARYDRSLHRAARLLERRGWEVTVDSGTELFPAGAGLPAALYAGWYRLARYVDAFRWQQGAVGYHIASSEAATLRAADSQVWCKRMLEEGVAATLGPVAEPYVQAFPPPELFFDLLTRGTQTLGEVYLHSVPHLSWQMVLVGDPLYRPFRRVEP